jgi:hypothetical protein
VLDATQSLSSYLVIRQLRGLAQLLSRTRQTRPSTWCAPASTPPCASGSGSTPGCPRVTSRAACPRSSTHDQRHAALRARP